MKTTGVLIEEESLYGIWDLVREERYTSQSDVIRHAIRDLLRKEGKLHVKTEDSP